MQFIFELEGEVNKFANCKADSLRSGSILTQDLHLFDKYERFCYVSGCSFYLYVFIKNKRN